METKTEQTEKAKEYRLRKRCMREGLAMRKSRKDESVDNLGQYMLVTISDNIVIAGERYEMSLSDIEAFLNAE